MKQNILIIYFFSSSILYKYNTIESQKEFKSIIDGKINNLNLFKTEFSEFLKMNNINNALIGDTIYYISLDNTYLENEKIKEILTQYSFKNVLCMSFAEFLARDKTYAILDDNKFYLYANGTECSFTIHGLESSHITLNDLIESKKIDNMIYIIKNNNKKLFDYLKEHEIELYNIYNPNDYIIDKVSKKVTNV